MAKKNKKIGRVLIWLGIVGVLLPHIGFLLGFFPTLNDPSHSYFEIASAVAIGWGAMQLTKK